MPLVLIANVLCPPCLFFVCGCSCTCGCGCTCCRQREREEGVDEEDCKELLYQILFSLRLYIDIMKSTT